MPEFAELKERCRPSPAAVTVRALGIGRTSEKLLMEIRPCFDSGLKAVLAARQPELLSATIDRVLSDLAEQALATTRPSLVTTVPAHLVTAQWTLAAWEWYTDHAWAKLLGEVGQKPANSACAGAVAGEVGEGDVVPTR